MSLIATSTQTQFAAPLAAILLLLAPACGVDPALDIDGEDADEEQADQGSEDPDDGSEDPEDSGEAQVDGPSCDYTSLFTGSDECRDYVGAAWTEADVNANCSEVQGQTNLEAGCAIDGVLGRCTLDGGTDWELQVVIYGADASSCDLQAAGCETFGGGTWKPEPICAGSGGGGGGDENVFIQPERTCVQPIDGEPPGQSEGAQVCTWQAISGSTEAGRHFEDYGSCDVVRTQRPYYGAPPAAGPAQPDPRLDDPEYLAELGWVRDQVEASACVCCHSESSVGGPSNWYVEAPGNWVDSFYDTGLALGAGWVDSTSFGAFPPEENNGFDRINSGIPSTDPERMVAFFVAELAYRGRSEADFADTPPFGGPLYDQLVYEPSACENGEGVKPDGSIVWTGGLARYVYVLEADASSPTVPPNLDLPLGTLWRIDVPWDGGEPVSSGEISYALTPTGMSQRYPVDGAPTGLVPGKDYYLYVSRDVGIPITRCLFSY
jgi:hypothetical protein